MDILQVENETPGKEREGPNPDIEEGTKKNRAAQHFHTYGEFSPSTPSNWNLGLKAGFKLQAWILGLR